MRPQCSDIHEFSGRWPGKTSVELFLEFSGGHDFANKRLTGGFS